MTSQHVLTIAQAALHMLLMTAAPILLVVLVVGLIVAILQAATQINEATLSFIPKLVAAVVVLIIIGPWLISTFVDYPREVLLSIPGAVGTALALPKDRHADGAIIGSGHCGCYHHWRAQSPCPPHAGAAADPVCLGGCNGLLPA